MERDFLSVGKCRDSVPVMKEENRGLCLQDSGFVSGTVVHNYHYQNGSPFLYQPVPLKAAEDYNSKGAYIQPPPVFQPKQIVDNCRNNYMLKCQKMFNQDMEQYLNQHSAHFNSSQMAHAFGSSFLQPMRVGNLPVTPHFATPVVDNSQILRDGHTSTVLSPVAAHIKHKEIFQGGTSLNFPVVGSTHGAFLPWNLPKTPSSNSQLTIFYKGAVVVYDDVSLQKAEEVMLVAGNPSCTTNKVANSISQSTKADAQVPYAFQIERAGDELGFSTCSRVPAIIQKVPKDQKMVERAVKPSTKSRKQEKTAETVTSDSYIYRAIPQARKATLARFLEKRKERLTHCVPYSKHKSNAIIDGSANVNSLDNPTSFLTVQGQVGQSSCLQNPTKNA